MVRSCIGTVLSFCADKFSAPSHKQAAAIEKVAAILAPANINARPSKILTIAAGPQLRLVRQNARVRSRPCLDNFM